MTHSRIFPVLLILVLSSCIGTDIVEAPEGTEKLELSPKMESLLVGQMVQLFPEYTNLFGNMEDIIPEFHTLTPSTLAVDEMGIVSALDIGRGEIYASFGALVSDTAIINVVASETEVAEIVITASKNQIELGEDLALMAEAFTVNDLPISTTFEWSSENPNIAAVSETGVVSGVSRGFTYIVVTAENIEVRFAISVGLTMATATFEGSSGYIANGTATLEVTEQGLILSLSNDFETSFALGTYVYLANSTSGREVKSNGFQVSEITRNGSHTFNITNIAESKDQAVLIGQHKYVIILCEPASLTFGFADLDF